MLSTAGMHAGKLLENSRSHRALNRVKRRLIKKLEDQNLKWGSPIYLRIFKAENVLEVWIHNDDRFHLFNTYEVCTYGGKGLGPKCRQGDGKAPEGFYFVTPNQMNPYSSYHLSFNIGYPNRFDQAHGRTGGSIMVHGDCVSIGCIAMTDEKIEEIYSLAYAALKNGQPYFRVHIFPFRMTPERMKMYEKSEWIAFWENLKIGYDFFFDHNHNPPNVTIEKKKYVFNEID